MLTILADIQKGDRKMKIKNYTFKLELRKVNMLSIEDT